MTHYVENAHVPQKDSPDDQRMRDVVGTKTDRADSDSLYGRSYVQERHVHSEQMVYPTGAPGVLVTGGGGAWTLGAFVELIPASTITSPFDLHHVFLTDISAQKDYELVFYQGAGDTECGRIRFTRTAGLEPILDREIRTPIIPANSRVRARLASAGAVADTLDVSLQYHEYT